MLSKDPKVIMLGIKHKWGKDLVRDLYEQNSELRKVDFEFFEKECILPERCWPSRTGDLHVSSFG